MGRPGQVRRRRTHAQARGVAESGSRRVRAMCSARKASQERRVVSAAGRSFAADTRTSRHRKAKRPPNSQQPCSPAPERLAVVFCRRHESERGRMKRCRTREMPGERYRRNVKSTAARYSRSRAERSARWHPLVPHPERIPLPYTCSSEPPLTRTKQSRPTHTTQPLSLDVQLRLLLLGTMHETASLHPTSSHRSPAPTAPDSCLHPVARKAFANVRHNTLSIWKVSSGMSMGDLITC